MRSFGVRGAYGRARDVRMGAYTRDMIGVKCLRALRRGVCVGAPLGGVVTRGGGGIGENPGGGGEWRFPNARAFSGAFAR